VPKALRYTLPMSAFRDNSDRVLPVRLDPEAPDVLAVVRPIVATWAAVTEAQVSVMGGGITNLLLRVDAAGLDPVLVRIYGPNTEVVIDRESENRLFAQLSRAGFAPAYLGRFENGRVEGFLNGFRALEPHELVRADLQPPIARRLAELHGFSVGEGAPRTFVTLSGWMRAARSLRFEGADAARYHALDLPRWDAELRRLRRAFEQDLLPGATRPGQAAAVRAVLAHNDLLAGNVMLHTTSGEVRFIDYEYGACGYAAFDIANHFCEYAGFDSDFASGFPDADARARFVAAYLTAQLAPQQASGAVADPQATRDFCEVVDFFVLVNHLWWGAWALIQARHSPIDFDFMDYARLRFAGFEYHSRGL
jgi:ethanolamine kinase